LSLGDAERLPRSRRGVAAQPTRALELRAGTRLRPDRGHARGAGGADAHRPRRGPGAAGTRAAARHHGPRRRRDEPSRAGSGGSGASRSGRAPTRDAPAGPRAGRGTAPVVTGVPVAVRGGAWCAVRGARGKRTRTHREVQGETTAMTETKLSRRRLLGLP